MFWGCRSGRNRRRPLLGGLAASTERNSGARDLLVYAWLVEKETHMLDEEAILVRMVS